MFFRTALIKDDKLHLITLIGGKDNVISAAHCATRLRIVLKDDKKVNIKEIEEVDLVKGSFNNGGQFQIILGTGIVDEVYKYFISLCDISEMSKEQLKEVSAKKSKRIAKVLKGSCRCICTNITSTCCSSTCSILYYEKMQR